MSRASEEAKDKVADKANVVAVGHGKKVRNGTETGEDALVAFVRSKKGLQDLDAEDVVPEEVDGVQTDVQEVGMIEIEPIEPESAEKQSSKNYDPTQKMRPYPQGSSIGHQDITAGTAGRRMWEKDNMEFGGEEVIYANPVQYSNNHVLANENKADAKDSVLQPGPHDGGKNIDDEYRVNNWIKYVKLEDKGNLVDGAWCDLKGRIADEHLVNAGVPRVPAEVEKGDTVYKPRGRTTGYREGRVLSTDAVVNVKFSSGTKRFKNQIITTSISRPGDSGSTVVKDVSGSAKVHDVGTLFAGSKKVTIVNKIQDILDETGLYLNPEDVYNDTEGE